MLSYDYSVLAGTQGQMNHRKKDRLFGLVERLRLPVVLFAEGGGGRPGDTDVAAVTGLDTEAFALFGALEPAGCRSSASSRGAASAGKRGFARLLSRDHRHARRHHRDGRSRDDRGGRPRCRRRRRRRTGGGAGGQRGDRRPRR